MERRNKDDSHDRGDALIIAIIAAMLVTLIPAAMVAAASSQLPQSQANQGAQAALAAAEAGVSNYENLLNQYSVNQLGNYWQYDANNPPPIPNAALTGWEQVAGSNNEYFHYSVDNSTTARSGVVTLTSTGVYLHGNLTQEATVRATLRSESFLDYLIFDNRMIVDPVFAPYVAHMPVHNAEQECNFSFYQPNGSSQAPTTGPVLPACESLLNYYVTGQVFNGPIFTNDIYYLSGSPTFEGPAYSASPLQGPNQSHPYWLDPLSAYLGQPTDDNPTFSSGGNVLYHSTLNLPQSDGELAQIAQQGGCYYYGPTSITLHGSTMTVVSPQTKNSPCVGTNVALPSNGVIYVGSLPANQSDTCSGTTTLSTVGQSVPCQEGNAFIQGQLSGQLTVASANDITITGNLEYSGCLQNGSTDLLGLIANNFVQVSDKFASTNQTADTCFGHPSYDPTIMAAILTLQHSFAVQDFWRIPFSGTIYLYGALAGYYADIEGTFVDINGQPQVTNGYLTNYSYDKRLQYLEPPYFLSPVGASWLKLSEVQVDNPPDLPSLPS